MLACRPHRFLHTEIDRLMRSLRSALLTLLIVVPGFAREKKEYDADVNYDEARIPKYDLPPLLVTSSGKRISTPDEWHQIRRP